MGTAVQSDPILTLQSQVGEEWNAIQQARAKTAQTNSRLEKVLDGLSSTDAAIVVFGSLARDEWTQSDVDWTLLIDGQADPKHLPLPQEFPPQLENKNFTPPRQTAISAC